VEAGSDEAKKARATVEQVKGNLPSYQEMANEKLKKSRDRFKLKELEEKAKPRAKRRVSPKESVKKEVDAGAAVAVELRTAINEAKQAILHKDKNPGDKKAEIDAGEAMALVKKLTKKQAEATINDGKLQLKAENEIEQKTLQVKASKELARKHDSLKRQVEFNALQRIVAQKKREKLKLEDEVKIADQKEKLEKQMAVLAEKREQANLRKAEWEAREQAKKQEVKTAENDNIETVKAKEQNMKMTDKVKETEEKNKSRKKEVDEKDAMKTGDKLRRDEEQERLKLGNDKAKVIKMIQKAEAFNRKLAKEKAAEEITEKTMVNAGKKVGPERKEFEAKTKKRKDLEKQRMMRRIDKITRKQATASDKLKKDEKKSAVIQSTLNKDKAADAKAKAKADKELEAAQEKSDEATAKDGIDEKMTVYEENLKQRVQMEVNGPYRDSLKEAVKEDVSLKKDMDVEMEKRRAQMKAESAKTLNRKLRERVYTVGEAKELEKLIDEKVKTKTQNRIWTEITNERAAQKGKDKEEEEEAGEDPKAGVYMREDHKLGPEWSRRKEAEEVDPREKLHGGPKPWYNKTATAE